MAVGLPILVAAWWAFRPEKLWINQRVNEPAPFASSADRQPLYTGLLEGNAHPTGGRATIYETSNGKRYLRLTDFMTAKGPDLHVVLARGDDKGIHQEIVKGDLDRVDLGRLADNLGDQDFDLPASVDLQKYDAVVIYSEPLQTVFGVARIEQF
jgi:hypothetical protein